MQMKARVSRAVALVGVGVATLVAAPVAFAAPPPSGLGTSTGPVTAASEVTFSWSASAPDGPGNAVRYEGGIGDELTDFGGSLSVTRALPEGRFTFRVRAVETDSSTGLEVPSGFSTVGVVVDRTAPTITGSAPSGWRRAAAVSFTCGDTGSSVVRCGPDVTVVTEGAGQSVTGTAADAAGNTATATVGGIDIDRSVPTTPVVTAPAAPTSDRTPLIEWTPSTDALSGVRGYRVYIDTPPSGRSTAFATGPSYRPSSGLAPGPHTVRIRALDAAGNAVNSDVRRFTISEAAATPGQTSQVPTTGPANPAGPPEPEETPTGGGRTVFRPPTQNAHLLLPRAGLRVRTLQPVLRWKREPRGTTLSNVQLFRMRGRRIAKIHSAFPRSSRYRVPAGVLKPGGTYVWRVWPYRGRRGFTPRPLGVSFFRAGTVADLLPAAARARMLAPATPRVARRQPLALNWVARPGVRRYKVTVELGGRRVFADLALGTSLTVPGRVLRRAGTYAVIVRSARPGSLRRFRAAPWAAAAVRAR